MMNWLLVLALLFAAAISFALYYLYDIIEWKNRRARGKGRPGRLSLVATELGMTFEPGAISVENEPFLAFALFRQGHSRHFTSAMRGKVLDDELCIFDYEYSRGSGLSIWLSPTVYTTVVAVRWHHRPLPEFCLSPESLSDIVQDLVDGHDVDFDDDPAFSDAYVLSGVNEAAIRRFFTADLRAMFVQESGWSVEAGGYWLVVFRGLKEDSRVPATEMKAFLRGVHRIVELFRQSEA